MLQLPPDDQRSIAWDFASAAATFATLPSASTSLRAQEFSSAVAIFLGIKDPHVVAAVATMGEGPFFFQDSQALRSLDPFGNALSLFMGAGHGRTAFHNAVQHELAYLARAVGAALVETPSDLFLSEISPHKRDVYARRLQNQARVRDGDFRGALLPDLYDPVSRIMYDVKTTGMKTEPYIARRSVVDEKAGTVPAQYKRRAMQADREYNDTPVGTVGPVEAKLASMAPVECFSVGAFGETNSAVSTFLGSLAEKGSDRPARFGCCHGKEQARGVVAQFLSRRLGRVLLRGTVRLRHRALDAAVLPGPPPSAHAGCAEATFNEWDAGYDSWVPPPGEPPAA